MSLPQVRIEFVGQQAEFGGQDVVIDNYVVPNIKAHPLPDESVEFVLDRRFGITIEKDEVISFICFVADAMAVAAGYSSFGENSRLLNPYRDAYRVEGGSGETEPKEVATRT